MGRLTAVFVFSQRAHPRGQRRATDIGPDPVRDRAGAAGVTFAVSLDSPRIVRDDPAGRLIRKIVTIEV